MNRYFPFVVLALLSSTTYVQAARTVGFKPTDALGELSKVFNRLHHRNKIDPHHGQKLIERKNIELEQQRNATKAKQDKDAADKKVKNWKDGLRMSRFSSNEQKNLELVLPQIIASFEEEQKISGGTINDIFPRLLKLSFQNLMVELQKLGKNKVLSQQMQKKLDLEKKIEASNTMKYKYNREDYVFFNELKTSYYNGNIISNQKNYDMDKPALNNIYTILNIHENGPVGKKHKADTEKARKDVLDLIKKPTGIVFLPTNSAGVNALIKLLRGPKQNVEYLFYKDQNLCKGLITDARYMDVIQNYTIVGLDNPQRELTFAIPKKGPEGSILSLCSKQILLGGDMLKINALAEAVWNRTIGNTKIPEKIVEKSPVHQQKSVSHVPTANHTSLATRTPVTGIKISSATSTPVTGIKTLSAMKTPVTGTKISSATSTQITGTKISSATSTQVTGIKTLSATKTPVTGTKISSATSTQVTGIKTLSATKTPVTGTKISSATSTQVTGTKISSATSTQVTGTKISSATSTQVTGIKTLSATKTPVTGTKISSATSTQVTGIKTLSATKTPVTGTKISSAMKTPVTGTKISSATKTPVTGTKISSAMKTPVTGIKTLSATKTSVRGTKTLSATKTSVTGTKTPAKSRLNAFTRSFKSVRGKALTAIRSNMPKSHFHTMAKKDADHKAKTSATKLHPQKRLSIAEKSLAKTRARFFKLTHGKRI